MKSCCLSTSVTSLSFSVILSSAVKNILSRRVRSHLTGIHPEIYQSDTILKGSIHDFAFPSTSTSTLSVLSVLIPVCCTQRCCKEVRSYLLLKSGVDSDLPADHQASSSAYQPVPVAPAWTALYVLSVTQDVEQHRHWPNSG